jgi:hypothetical protein
MAEAKDDAVMAEAQVPQPLGRWPILSYGVGHMLNDITSACWFTYLLLFLQQIGLAPRYNRISADSITLYMMLSFFPGASAFTATDFEACVAYCRDAAVVMLSGQVADGLMTILAGEMVRAGLKLNIICIL